MSVTLAGISLNPNLILNDRINRNAIMYSITRNLDGSQTVLTSPTSDSSIINLTALDMSVKQGWYCTEQIELLRDIAALGASVELIYNGELINVVILEFDLEEWYSWEPPGPYKRWSGNIKLLEV